MINEWTTSLIAIPHIFPSQQVKSDNLFFIGRRLNGEDGNSVYFQVEEKEVGLPTTIKGTYLNLSFRLKQ